jgi:hypothetical protein
METFTKIGAKLVNVLKTVVLDIDKKKCDFRFGILVTIILVLATTVLEIFGWYICGILKIGRINTALSYVCYFILKINDTFRILTVAVSLHTVLLGFKSIIGKIFQCVGKIARGWCFESFWDGVRIVQNFVEGLLECCNLKTIFVNTCCWCCCCCLCRNKEVLIEMKVEKIE